MFAFSLALAIAAAPKMDLAKVHTIVMMGDSITAIGGGPKGYVTLIHSSLDATRPGDPFNTVNVGIGGQKAPDMFARFQKDVVDRKPDLVFISVGVNDVWHDYEDFANHVRHPAGDLGHGVKLPDYVKGVESMIDLAKGAGAQVVLVSPTLVYEDLDCVENRKLTEYVRAEEGLAKRRGVGFVDLNRVFRETVAAYQKNAGRRQLLLTVDGVHMNDAGNALMADTILRYLGVAIPDNVGAK